MIQNIEIQSGKKIYFASDFHLGVPSTNESLEREKRIVKWMNTIKNDAAALFLVGDIFDFWFEYKTVIPKGFLRFQSKLVELSEAKIPIYIFTGNHDMWLFDYFQKELGIPILRNSISFSSSGKKIMLGHGDGLGPGDGFYKILKKIFANKFCQFLFKWLHPDIGMAIAKSWSKHSRAANMKKEDKSFGEQEWLVQHCKKIELENHHDFYIFGHRHLPFEFQINENSKYINLGEWVNYNTYAVFDGNSLQLKKFEA